MRDLVRLRRLRAPPALRHAAATAWAQLSPFSAPPPCPRQVERPAASRAAADDPALELVLDLADAAGSSMLPFRT